MTPLNDLRKQYGKLYSMAEVLRNITIASPAFAGINTQGSPSDLPPAFAAVADNCIIDRKGRIAARQGIQLITTDDALLGTSAGIEAIFEFEAYDGTKTVFSAGNNKVFTGTATLVDVTPGAASISANNWKIVSLANKCYFFQAAHAPMVFTAGGSLELVTAAAGYLGTVPEGNEVLAAYGRLWVCDIGADKATIYWSDLQNGVAWTGGSSGSINIGEFWPDGYDVLTSLKAHNDFLICFGKRSMLVYGGATEPSTMALRDTIDKIGCINRDCSQNTGTDLFFLDYTGVRSLGRTIQEKASPIGDISKNVNSDVQTAIAIETNLTNVRTHYNTESAFFLVTFPASNKTYCFDTRAPLQDGSHRATTWSIVPLAFHRADDATLYLGDVEGIAKYSGAQDKTLSYLFSYRTHPLTFQNELAPDASTRIKFLKKVVLTTEGGQGDNAALLWSYDYTSKFTTQLFNIRDVNLAYYGVSEYNVSTSEYSEYEAINREKINTSGGGTLITVGVDNTVDGNDFAVQEMNIHALLGRIL
jgi:hypothetical protein